jgi:hypothetical protein
MEIIEPPATDTRTARSNARRAAAPLYREA